MQKIYDELMKTKAALKLDFPESWTVNPGSVINSLGQIRGTIRALAGHTPSESLEKMFSMISALETTRTLGPQFAKEILNRVDLKIPGDFIFYS